MVDKHSKHSLSLTQAHAHTHPQKNEDHMIKNNQTQKTRKQIILSLDPQLCVYVCVCVLGTFSGVARALMELIVSDKHALTLTSGSGSPTLASLIYIDSGRQLAF